MPKDLAKGKARIVFANIQILLEFHKKILPDIEKSKWVIDDANIAYIENMDLYFSGVEEPRYLPRMFSKHKSSMKKRYGMFCINKPKSDFIQTEHEEFFSVSVKSIFK